MTVPWLLATGWADWPQLHGNAAHDGRAQADLRPPFRLAWVREFAGERLGTAMEPIVAGGQVFVATHQGNLYALGAALGDTLWRFASHGPLLHSPAAGDSMVFVASADGGVYALDTETGWLRWSAASGDGGFAAAPVVGQGAVFVGTRAGTFLAIEAQTGSVRWRHALPAPIRQTAALGDGRVYVTAEDLRVRCFMAADGLLIWESPPLSGQSARDYYPVVVSAGGRARILIRTNPARNMAQQIARDRSMLWFDHSGVAFEALAWAYPHLPAALQARTRTWLADELETHPPFERSAWYQLGSGQRREWHSTPMGEETRLGHDRPFHPFGNVAAVALCGQRLALAAEMRGLWPRIRASFHDFQATGWRLDPDRGDLFANRYLGSCLMLRTLAIECGDPETSAASEAVAQDIGEALIAWWKRAGATGTLTQFEGPAELDPFIGKGDALSLRLAPHRHKLGLFHDLTPSVAQRIRRDAPEAADALWRTFTALYATWSLVGEERQVHFGENSIDPPDLAMDGFRALAWLRKVEGPELACRVDLPFCRADLYYLLARRRAPVIALDTQRLRVLHAPRRSEAQPR